jgi:hypothetical protein
VITGDLIEAYRGTRYTVLDADGVVVAEARIDELAPTVDALLDAHAATSGVFVTAWNPRSRPTDPGLNERAHDRLVAEVTRAGLIALPHHGVGADPAWTEEGLFVVAFAETDAIALATAHEQNAIVVVDVGQPARLVPTSLMP